MRSRKTLFSIFLHAFIKNSLFVIANRSKNSIHPTHSFDIVVGPVADDTIVTFFRNFDEGIIDLPILVNGLRYKKISSQYFFYSADAIKYLKKR